jgi:hypothetical protein
VLAVEHGGGEISVFVRDDVSASVDEVMSDGFEEPG